MIKCPRCGNELVDIIYGLPDSETIKKVENKKAKLGGCEIILDMKQPVYYCYQCEEEYFEDLTIDNYLGVKELDRVKTKDGRIGTVMLVLHDDNNKVGFEIEFDDNDPETETIDGDKVVEIIRK